MPFLTKSLGSYKVGVAIIMGDKVLSFPVTYLYFNTGFLESIVWGAGQAIKGGIYQYWISRRDFFGSLSMSLKL